MSSAFRIARSAVPWILLAALMVIAAFLLLPVPRGFRAGAPATARAASDDWTGKAAPDFTLSTLDGQRIHLSDYRGRVVLLNFWATWCAPCRVEMPWLTEFDARYRARGLTILGISVDDAGRRRVESFVREQHVGYPILLKDKDIDLRYGGVRFLPQTFFIGRDGTIVQRRYGIRTRADFEADVRRALGLQ